MAQGGAVACGDACGRATAASPRAAAARPTAGTSIGPVRPRRSRRRATAGRARRRGVRRDGAKRDGTGKSAARGGGPGPKAARPGPAGAVIGVASRARDGGGTVMHASARAAGRPCARDGGLRTHLRARPRAGGGGPAFRAGAGTADAAAPSAAPPGLRPGGVSSPPALSDGALRRARADFPAPGRGQETPGPSAAGGTAPGDRGAPGWRSPAKTGLCAAAPGIRARNVGNGRGRTSVGPGEGPAPAPGGPCLRLGPRSRTGPGGPLPAAGRARPADTGDGAISARPAGGAFSPRA